MLDRWVLPFVEILINPILFIIINNKMMTIWYNDDKNKDIYFLTKDE
jgi:hypothetical protein